MTFKSEADFEEALIRVLQQNAWEKEVIKYPTEQDLIRNWADILYDNNRSIDRLGDNPLTDGEMQQIIEQIRELRTPLKLNGFINGKTVSISIPMAHQLIGFYTVADDSDGVLKVMRSYQYYAANAISDVVSKTKWDHSRQRGGYVWHTTGSGKTMTSFKSAQLIANSHDADKVIFLTDRIELGTQSLKEYRAFAEENESVQATENTYVLLSKLKSNAAADTLIVTSTVGFTDCGRSNAYWI